MYIKLLFVFRIVQVVSYTLRDIQDIFGDKRCIEEASFVIGDPVTSFKLLSNEVESQSPIFNNSLQKTNEGVNNKNVLSQINQLAQLHKISYYYELKNEEGPPHSRIFTVELTLGNEIYEGEGSSLKNAQRAAAATALLNTNYNLPVARVQKQKDAESPTVQLNNIALKLGIKIRYELLDLNELEKALAVAKSMKTNFEGKPRKSYLSRLNHTIYHSLSEHLKIKPGDTDTRVPPFVMCVHVDDEYYVGIGLNIQSAKHDAALKALEDMQKKVVEEHSHCNLDGFEESCRLKKEAIKSPITQVYELAQRRKLGVQFEIVSESGKPHKKMFVTRCTVGEFITEADGKSKKESKRFASEKMLELLKTELLPSSDPDYSDLLKKTKKNKKKKKKMVKSVVEKLDVELTGVFSSISDYVSDLVNAPKDPPPKPKSKRATNTKTSGNNVNMKGELLHLTQTLGIHIQFTDLQKFEGKFFTFLSLDMKPRYVCLGDGESVAIAHTEAAFEGLKLLLKLGFVTDLSLKESIEERLDLIEDSNPMYLYFTEDEVQSDDK